MRGGMDSTDAQSPHASDDSAPPRNEDHNSEQGLTEEGRAPTPLAGSPRGRAAWKDLPASPQGDEDAPQGVDTSPVECPQGDGSEFVPYPGERVCFLVFNYPKEPLGFETEYTDIGSHPEPWLGVPYQYRACDGNGFWWGCVVLEPSGEGRYKVRIDSEHGSVEWHASWAHGQIVPNPGRRKLLQVSRILNSGAAIRSGLRAGDLITGVMGEGGADRGVSGDLAAGLRVVRAGTRAFIPFRVRERTGEEIVV
eukprot:Hpha_TRINITY_DN31672_c0_g1::TRINITY_DN31672_c0_g1_i1::g.29155::m.29155